MPWAGLGDTPIETLNNLMLDRIRTCGVVHSVHTDGALSHSATNIKSFKQGPEGWIRTTDHLPISARTKED